MGSSIRKDFKYASVRANRLAFIESKIWFDHDKNPRSVEDAKCQLGYFMTAMSVIKPPVTKSEVAYYWATESMRGLFHDRPIADLIVPHLVSRVNAFDAYKDFDLSPIRDCSVTAAGDDTMSVSFAVIGTSLLTRSVFNSNGCRIPSFFDLRATDLNGEVKFMMTFKRPAEYPTMGTICLSRYREEEKAREAAKLAKPKPPKPAAVNDPSVEVGVANVASLTRRAVKAVNQTIQEYLERLKMEEAAAATAAKEASAKLVEARRVAEQTRLRHEELQASIKNFQETIVASIKP
ncbi:hypothetical protein AHP1_851 [Aeromonas phage Ahp1_CNU-2021]|nr:hypothetical protein AHP1_851 [Aeromonas phage Ahp1_CNU-2021]